jgi:CubicO group peptidase (beta-lactamase class C family)
MRRFALMLVGALVFVVAVVAIAVERFEIGAQMAVFTGGAAKLMCSGVFVAGRAAGHVRAEDFNRRTTPGKFIGLATTEVDFADKSVRGTLFGLMPRTAIYREGIGCTDVDGRTIDEVRAEGAGVPSSLPPPGDEVQWPEGEATLALNPPKEIDAAALKAAVDFAFAEPDPEQPRRTRGVVIVHRGRIVAERYAPGFDKSHAHLSNSVAKSFTSALVGILVGLGKLKVEDPAPIDEWQKPGDPRGAITLDNLLRMSSGLEFEENYTKIKSDTTMQFVNGDLSGFAIAKPLVAQPGAVWSYSTGTSNILGRIVRQAAGTTHAEAFAFPRRALFDKLGMRHTVIEVDAAGNFVGGSYVYASVRDFAKLGLLYLRDGIWNGERILPEGWVAYTRTPSAHTPGDRGYGAQFWLNTGNDPKVRRWPDLPPDTFAMNGHQGQHVFIVPSQDAVVVRVGLSEYPTWKVGEFVARALAALPKNPEKSVGLTESEGHRQ